MLLIEVLSPSTATYDRGEKLAHYQRIPSLREVVLVAHDERLLESWRRTDEGPWVRCEARSGTLDLAAIPATLIIEEVHRDELAPG